MRNGYGYGALLAAFVSLVACGAVVEVSPVEGNATPAVRKAVVEDVSAFGTGVLKLELLGVVESPVRGRDKGNIEYLAHWRKGRM